MALEQPNYQAEGLDNDEKTITAAALILFLLMAGCGAERLPVTAKIKHRRPKPQLMIHLLSRLQ